MEITRELLEKYHRGVCTAEQERAVEDWLNLQPPETDFPAHLGDGKLTEDLIWTAMSKNLGFIEDQKSYVLPDDVLEKPSRNQVFSSWFMRVAASVLLISVLGYSFWFWTNQHLNAKTQALAISKSDPRTYVTVITKAGERKKYVLPDGSQVTLNAESELRYPVFFLLTDTLRRVDLKGEAFFSVQKDPERPFVVHTKRSSTRVLGTRFNLRAYDKEASVTLVVQEGKVRFSSTPQKQQLILTANQRGILNSSGKLVKENVYAYRHLAWTDNKLVFENRPLEQIATDLQRWYGIQVVIKNPDLKHNRYTGSFDSKPIREVLETMGYAVGFKFKAGPDKVIIY